jgi:hypothetical protein
MAPVANLDALYFTFLLNQRETPAFSAGGLQIQAWNGDNLVTDRQGSNQAVLSTQGETIRWTQVLRLTENGLVFEVLNGTSTTWGPFGGEGSLAIALNSQLVNLNGYDPAVSASHSGVSFASNRVQSLKIRSVRTYSAGGLIAEDNNPRVVHSLNE